MVDMVKNKIKEESLRSVAIWRIFSEFFDGEKREKIREIVTMTGKNHLVF